MCLSAISIYVYDKKDGNNNCGLELYYGDLIRTSVNNTTDSAIFKVVMNGSMATRDGEYSPLGENNSYLKIDIEKKQDGDYFHYNNINWTYIDTDNSSTVTTDDKVVVYNRSRYVGVKTDFVIEIYMGTLARETVGSTLVKNGI